MSDLIHNWSHAHYFDEFPLLGLLSHAKGEIYLQHFYVLSRVIAALDLTQITSSIVGL